MSDLTLSEIAAKAESYADELSSVEGLKGALRILAGNVRAALPAGAASPPTDQHPPWTVFDRGDGTADVMPSMRPGTVVAGLPFSLAKAVVQAANAWVSAPAAVPAKETPASACSFGPDHICRPWKLAPDLTWVCAVCGCAAPPVVPGHGDPIRVACPACDAPGFTRAELALHRCAAPQDTPGGTGTAPKGGE